MNIETQKITLVQRMLSIQSKDVLDKLESVLNLNRDTIPEWQMKEVNRRMEEYYKNPEIAEDFDTAMDEIERDL